MNRRIFIFFAMLALAALLIAQPVSAQFTIQIDATALSAPELNLSGIGTFSTQSVQPFSLTSGAYSLFYISGVGQAGVNFTVTNAGTVDFDTELDGVLTGRGTATLVVQGRSIQIDGATLSAPSLVIQWGPTFDFPTQQVFSATVLPGLHRLFYVTGVAQAGVNFTVTNAGTVDFSSSLDEILDGRGTPKLTLLGALIEIDARALSTSLFHLGGIDDFSTVAVQSISFLPGLHELKATNLQFVFSVIENVTVDYDCSLDPILFGRGTSRLVVGTPEERIEHLIDQVEELANTGVLNNGQGESLIVKLELAIKSLDKGDTDAAGNHLQAFINQVNAFINAGMLSPGQGQSLIDEANNTINQIDLIDQGCPQNFLLSKENVTEAIEHNFVRPSKYALHQNYPNPFNPDTEIHFQLPEANHVVVKIFNALGKEIRMLVNGNYGAGYHSVRWDGKDLNGIPVSSGVYLYKLQVGNFSQVKKMSLLR